MTSQEVIVGKWRLTAMSTWERDNIDLAPRSIAFAVCEMSEHTGEPASGAVTATLDCDFDATKRDSTSTSSDRRR